MDGANFQRGRSSWDTELVCESEVPVLCETVVNDIYERLLEEEAAGNITLCRYECNDWYRQRISKHIVDRLIRFEVDLHACMETDGRFSEHYKGIVEALLSVMDGHLLKKRDLRCNAQNTLRLALPSFACALAHAIFITGYFV